MTSPVALVTGAARGIGLAITQSLIAAGYRVMAADLGTDQAWNYQLGQSADIAQALQAANPSTDNAPPYAVCTVDVTNAEACEQAVQKTIETFGQLNLLVNNAGIVDSGPITAFSEAAWDRIFAVNTKGIFQRRPFRIFWLPTMPASSTRRRLRVKKACRTWPPTVAPNLRQSASLNLWLRSWLRTTFG